MEKTQEIWKDIPNYEGYQVSNKGNVKSLKRKCKVLVLHPRNGYLCAVGCINGKERKISAHRAVAIAFIPNPLNKSQVNHINGIKIDNRVENLEWCTNAENMAHAVKNGLTKSSGMQNHNAKLTDEIVFKIREMASKGMNSPQIAKEIKVVKTWSVYYIIKRKSWKHI